MDGNRVEPETKELRMDGPTPATRHGRSLPKTDATVTGVFRDPDDATQAVRRLTSKSVPVDSIRVFVVDEQGRRRRELAVEDEAGALKGGAIGAGIGAAVGLLIVILVPVVTGVASPGTPGVSTLFGALQAIAWGAVAGIPLGIIIGMGRWQGRKKIEEAGLVPHRMHVIVESEALGSVARDVLERSGAERVDWRGDGVG
jgi:hypothetical protein